MNYLKCQTKNPDERNFAVNAVMVTLKTLKISGDVLFLALKSSWTLQTQKLELPISGLDIMI